MPETPEQKARRAIDADLTAAGWAVQDLSDLDLTAGRGIAAREFQLKPGFGFADYLLYLDRKAVGAVEAKAEGTLTASKRSRPSTPPGFPTISPHTDAHCRSSSSRTARSVTSPTDSIPRHAAAKSSTSRDQRRWPSGWASRPSCGRD